MTPAPQKKYIITEEELDELETRAEETMYTGAIVIGSNVRSRQYTSASSDVLEELWEFCKLNGVVVRDNLIGFPGDGGFLLLKLLKKIAELRQQTKEP
jgi:hypothetical protein